MPETDPICWKCGGELATLDVHPVKYHCATCGHDLDARTAFNPTHAKAMHEAAEGLLEGKECPQERLQVIGQELLQHAAAAKAAVRLFPALFAAKAAGGMLGPMDPGVTGEMCGEVLQHAIWTTGQLNEAQGEARIWLMRVRDCPLAASGAEQACRMRDIAIEGLKAMGLDREPAAKA